MNSTTSRMKRQQQHAITHEAFWMLYNVHRNKRISVYRSNGSIGRALDFDGRGLEFEPQHWKTFFFLRIFSLCLFFPFDWSKQIFFASQNIFSTHKTRNMNYFCIHFIAYRSTSAMISNLNWKNQMETKAKANKG